jgi:hypothetical protein
MIWRFLEDRKVAPETLMSAFPVGRIGRPEELVAAVRCLCSDDARYMNRNGARADGRRLHGPVGPAHSCRDRFGRDLSVDEAVLTARVERDRRAGLQHPISPAH